MRPHRMELTNQLVLGYGLQNTCRCTIQEAQQRRSWSSFMMQTTSTFSSGGLLGWGSA